MNEGERSSILAPRVGTLVSALALAASLPPWDVPGLAFVALVPWLASLRRTQGLLAAAVQGEWLAFATALLVAPWLAVGLREFLQMPWWVAALGLVAFAALAAWPQWVAFALVFRGAVRRLEGRGATGALGALALALAWMGLETAVPRPLEVGLGYALHDAAHLRQLADLGGVPWLGFVVVLVNLCAWLACETWRRGGPRPVVAAALPLVLGAAVVAAAWGYGELRLRRLAAEAPARSLRVSIVQGSVPNRVRLAWAAGDDRAAEKQLSAYLLPTEELVARDARPDLVVWPEAAFPGAFGHAVTRAERRRSNELDRLVLRLGRPFAFGAYDLDGDLEGDEGDLRVYNGLFLVNPDYARPGRLGFVQRYRKHRLLPFAETLPFAGLFEERGAVRRWLANVGFFAAGPGATVLRLLPPEGPAVRVTPFICSESLDAGIAAEGARQGSQLLLNVGSDGWFGDWGEPQLHLAAARFRSIETRLPQVRAANSGISAVVLPDGEIAARSSFGAREVLEWNVPVPRAVDGGRSVFVRAGSSSALWCGLLGLAACVLLGVSARRRGPGGVEES